MWDKKEYRNLFLEAGHAQEEIDRRLQEIWNTFFYGKEDERIYFPAGEDMGYLCDTGNEDVRTEGVYHTYEVDGRVAEESVLHPVAITATVAQASLASQSPCRMEWVERFFQTPLREGKRRCYDNCLYFFAFLALSGKYRIW